MLWRTIDKMMEVIARKPESIPEGMPSIEAILSEISAARHALELKDTKLVLAHGDFKPSNVMRDGGQVVIIDFELAGPNYRGFDLMKVFRTSLPMSEDCMRTFFCSYAEALEERGCYSEAP